MKDIRSWLRRHPQPVKLRADGQVIVVGRGERKWADAEETIRAMGASRIDALSAEGEVLRSAELELDGELESTPATSSSTSSSSSDADDPAKVAHDRIVEAMAVIGREMRQCMRDSAEAHASAHRAAFDAMASIAQGMAESVNALQAALQTANERILALQSESRDDNELPALAREFLAAKAAATNGKGT